MSFFFPPDDPTVIDAETDLLTAEASSVDGFPTAPDASEDDDAPIGRSWAFDWGRQRFRRIGMAPAEVTDRDSLSLWVETVTRIGRYAYGIFSDEYGLEEPEEPIGDLVTTAVLEDLRQRLIAAVMTHERIQDVDATLIFQDDAIRLVDLTVTYDETNTLSIGDVNLT